MRIHITQRQSILGVLSLLTVTTMLLAAVLLVQAISNPTNGFALPGGAAVAFVISAALLYAYWRGWDKARYVMLAVLVIETVVLTPEPFITQVPSITILIPTVLALILAEPAWVIGSAVAIYLALLVKAGGQGTYADPGTMLLFSIVLGGVVIARLVNETAQRTAEENARQARDAQAQAERQAHDLEEANQLMTVQLDQQDQLLSLVATLETPVLPLASGILFAPIVGHIDSRRAQSLMTRLLEASHTHRARMVVLDISGVSTMDTAIAQAILHAVQSLRLLGCEVTISGISATVAMTMIHLGIDMDGVTTVRNPQEALARYMDLKVVPASTNGNGAHN